MKASERCFIAKERVCDASCKAHEDESCTFIANVKLVGRSISKMTTSLEGLVRWLKRPRNLPKA